MKSINKICSVENKLDKFIIKITLKLIIKKEVILKTILNQMILIQQLFIK